MNIKKVILKVFSANFIQLIAGIIVGFVVPSILNIEQYANLKTYTLLISYIGLLHFGFVDGLYLKYGGKKYEEINKEVLAGEHIFLLISEILITLLFCIISVSTKSLVMLLFSLSIVPYMIAEFFKKIYQASGEFSKYSKILYAYSITYLVLNILLACVFKSTNYIYYCGITIFSNIVSSIIFEIAFLLKIKTKVNFKMLDIGHTLKSGFVLMLGNLAVVLILGIDKWFVKLCLTTSDFSYYSFAVSMLNIINTLVSAVSITFYNYLFKNLKEENIEKLKNTLIIVGSFASTGYFVLSMIVSLYLKKYVPSLNIISITFAIFPYLTVISSLINNLYKVNKQENRYLKVVILILVISIIYNIIGIMAIKNTTGIAGATLLTMITWFVISSIDTKLIKLKIKDVIYLFISTLSFLLLSHYYSNIIGFLIYCILVLCSTIIIYRKTLLLYIKKVK